MIEPQRVKNVLAKAAEASNYFDFFNNLRESGINVWRP